MVTDDTMGEEDPLLARLLAAATAGAPPAGPANKRKPIRIVLDPAAHPVAKGNLCGQQECFHWRRSACCRPDHWRAFCDSLRPKLRGKRQKVLFRGSGPLPVLRPLRPSVLVRQRGDRHPDGDVRAARGGAAKRYKRRRTKERSVMCIVAIVRMNSSGVRLPSLSNKPLTDGRPRTAAHRLTARRSTDTTRIGPVCLVSP